MKNSIEKSAEPAAGRIRLYEEPVYLAALVMLSLAVAMTAAADFGVSMIVAPAYILSLKFPFLTFGRAEYIIQALLFAVFCILMRRVKPVYLFSFVTCVIYGFVLDAWRSVVPAFNPAVTAPGSLLCLCACFCLRAACCSVRFRSLRSTKSTFIRRCMIFLLKC